MGVTQGRIRPGARTYGIGSVVASILGLALIFFGGPITTTVGVVLVIVSVICLLLAVGTFLGDGDRDLAEEDQPTGPGPS